MALTDPVLTDEQARQIRDAMPVLSNRPPGIDLPDLLEAIKADALAEFANRPAGSAVILSAASTVLVTGAALAGLKDSPVVAVLGEADGVIHILHVVWDGVLDQFTITSSAGVTADRTVFWMVNGG